MSLFNGEFFNEDYFERGVETCKSYYQNYRWMPRRSFREALAVIDHLKLDDKSRVLDVGCAKGFLVRALRTLEINADGCDISSYALRFAPARCWDASIGEEWTLRSYTHAFLKDVLEHGDRDQILKTLELIGMVAPVLMCVIPMGDNGIYRIPEYHKDKSHLTAEDESWWRQVFTAAGWKVKSERAHVPGIKDNWSHYVIGNRVFVLERL